MLCNRQQRCVRKRQQHQQQRQLGSGPRWTSSHRGQPPSGTGPASWHSGTPACATDSVQTPQKGAAADLTRPLQAPPAQDATTTGSALALQAGSSRPAARLAPAVPAAGGRGSRDTARRAHAAGAPHSGPCRCSSTRAAGALVTLLSHSGTDAMPATGVSAALCIHILSVHGGKGCPQAIDSIARAPWASKACL